MRFADSAFRHGITEQSIRHVVETYGPADDVDLVSSPGDEGLLFVGDDHRGVPLEVIGISFRQDGGEADLLIIHAMPLRARYFREYERAMRETWGWKLWA